MLTFQYIEPQHTDIIQSFQCSDEISVELFLKEQALKLHQLRSAITRLYFDDNQNLVGYFTLYNDHVQVFQKQKEKYRWNLPDFDLFPAVKLHYIGVDSRFRKLGYGSYLLTEAVYVIGQIAKTSGCNSITVEALNSAVGFYEEYGFVLRQRNRGSGEFQNMALKLDELW